MNADVKVIHQLPDKFIIDSANGRQYQADFLCIACGGFPKPEQFSWLSLLGHTIQSPVPSLFTFNIPNNPVTQLMGVSVENALVKITGTKLSQQGPLLITHWGLSGPSVLKLSAWGARELSDKQYHFSILINWVPTYTEQSLRERWQSLQQTFSSQYLQNKNPFGLPARFVAIFFAAS